VSPATCPSLAGLIPGDAFPGDFTVFFDLAGPPRRRDQDHALPLEADPAHLVAADRLGSEAALLINGNAPLTPAYSTGSGLPHGVPAPDGVADGSFLTLRWSNPDSNLRSPLTAGSFRANLLAAQGSSSPSHSASFVQPSRIKYSASSADITTVPSSRMFRCRPEYVCTDPMPWRARRRTQELLG